MRRLFPVLTTSLLLVACASSIREWDPFTEEPVRPALGADSTDAQALYLYGERILRDAPQEAADAFYWASRIDPSWADPLYAQRVAVLMADPRIFSQYLEGSRSLMESPGVQKADSLYQRALTMNPFLHNRHDATAIRSVLVWRAEQSIRRQAPGTTVDRADLEWWVQDFLRTANPRIAAWLAHSEGRFDEALRHYGRALEDQPDDPELHADIGRALFLTGRYQESAEAFGRAVEARARADEEELVRIYESRALWEHSIGLIHELLGNPAEARDAYARALQEDLSYDPAHIRLGELALAEGDTMTALSQLALATDIQEGDAAVRLQHGRLLARVGRPAEARAEFERAIELEPYFALPYFELAVVLEENGRAEEAAHQYRAFLERARRGASDRGEAEARLARLEEALGVGDDR